MSGFSAQVAARDPRVGTPTYIAPNKKPGP